jgi:hypothetical protein
VVLADGDDEPQALTPSANTHAPATIRLDMTPL